MKKKSGKRWKSYCNSICTTCNTIFFVKTANRYCYENKYNLEQVQRRIAYKVDGVKHTIATGVIEGKKHQCDTATQNGDSKKEWFVYEMNYKKAIPDGVETYTYVLQETCKDFKIKYEAFIQKFNKIAKEIGLET